MSMLDAICRLLFHFRKHIADYFGGIVGCALGAGGVDSDKGELGPREGMIEVVF